MKFFLICLILILNGAMLKAQTPDSTTTYKKRVLENTELDILGSYYSQDGDNAAVTGGKGSEKLNDAAASIVVSVPLNADDILSIDANISAYSSASSSNIDPFDGSSPADPFVASSGASSSDTWLNANVSYSHSSDDRNQIWSADVSFSNEYDYTSFGIGGSYTRLFNEKNTELTLNAKAYFDNWLPVYPYELRPFLSDGDGLTSSISDYPITGNQNYSPKPSEFSNTSRNSYSIGLTVTQILSKRLQSSLEADLVRQQGLLSTPFQRVYFSDVEDSFMQDFQLADANELLPDTRNKIAIGGRLNFYLNEIFVLRGYYRFYADDWGIISNTASLEVPIKISTKFTLYPSYRYYSQTAADYFAPFETHLSSEQYYTSDYDLSKFTANQFGFGVSYTDIFTKWHIGSLGLKSIDLKYNHYARNSNFRANLLSAGVNFIVE